MPLMGHFIFTLTIHTEAIASESKINTTKHYTKQEPLKKKSLYLFLGGTKKRDNFSGVSMETRTTFCKGIPEMGVAQAVLFAC